MAIRTGRALSRYEVLLLSRGVGRTDTETREAFEARVLFIDNGDWNDKFMYHWCLDGVCTCGGMQQARELLLRSFLEGVGGGPGLPLFYRWKNVEVAAA